MSCDRMFYARIHLLRKILAVAHRFAASFAEHGIRHRYVNGKRCAKQSREIGRMGNVLAVLGEYDADTVREGVDHALPPISMFSLYRKLH